jgi:hypothetical protein
VDSFPQPLTHCLVRLRLLNTLWSLVVREVGTLVLVLLVKVVAVRAD